VVFGGDWPVCLLGSPVRGWVDALKQIIASRPEHDQRKLWSANALKFYKLSV
jgi:L-fuconolactonase